MEQILLVLITMCNGQWAHKTYPDYDKVRCFERVTECAERENKALNFSDPKTTIVSKCIKAL